MKDLNPFLKELDMRHTMHTFLVMKYEAQRFFCNPAP